MCTEGRDLASILALEAGVSLDLGSLDHRITEAGAVYLLHT
jgi:hypothetical protein